MYNILEKGRRRRRLESDLRRLQACTTRCTGEESYAHRSQPAHRCAAPLVPSPPRDTKETCVVQRDQARNAYYWVSRPSIGRRGLVHIFHTHTHDITLSAGVGPACAAYGPVRARAVKRPPRWVALYWRSTCEFAGRIRIRVYAKKMWRTTVRRVHRAPPRLRYIFDERGLQTTRICVNIIYC